MRFQAPVGVILNAFWTANGLEVRLARVGAHRPPVKTRVLAWLCASHGDVRLSKEVEANEVVGYQ
jgi:hypothetical protein